MVVNFEYDVLLIAMSTAKRLQWSWNTSFLDSAMNIDIQPNLVEYLYATRQWSLTSLLLIVCNYQ